MLSRSLIFLFFGLVSVSIQAQDLTLRDFLILAENNSYLSKEVEISNRSLSYQRKSYKAQFRPSIKLTSDPISLNRSYSPIVQPDGNVAFQRVNNNNGNIKMRIDQPIWQTGTDFFISSDLVRFDDYENDVRSYNSTPIQFGLNHTFFGFNSFKWQRKVQPLSFRTEDINLIKKKETVNIELINLFFEVLQLQQKTKISKSNINSYSQLMQRLEQKAKLGSSTLREIMQLKQSILSSERTYYRQVLDLKNAKLRLGDYIKNDSELPELKIPSEIPKVNLSSEQIDKLINNNIEMQAANALLFTEADQEIARKKSKKGFFIKTSTTFGYSDKGNVLYDVYRDSKDQLGVNISLAVPIMDWGLGQSNLQVARINKEKAKNQADQNSLERVRELERMFDLISFLDKDLYRSNEMRKITNEKHELSKKKYLEGEISLTELFFAVQDRDNSTRDYINSVKDYWVNYYQLRALTLYDLESGQSLISN